MDIQEIIDEIKVKLNFGCLAKELLLHVELLEQALSKQQVEHKKTEEHNIVLFEENKRLDAKLSKQQEDIKILKK